jgi:hypothetical protein
MMEAEKGGGTEEPSNKRAHPESVIPARAVQQTQPKPPPAAPKPVATLLWLSGQLPAAQRGRGGGGQPSGPQRGGRGSQESCGTRGACRPVLWNRNWNRNRRNRNFLPYGRGTGTVTCQKVGTRTVIGNGSGAVMKWYHKSSKVLTNTQYKSVYFLNLNFFSFTFYNKFDETDQFFLVKKLRM